MILSVQPEATLTIPLSLIFWCNVVVYIFHIFEESVLGEVFVMKVRRLYFHAYEWKYFAGTFKGHVTVEREGSGFRTESAPGPLRLILTALANTRGRRIEAAHKLGIGRNTITRKIQELNLE